MYVCMCVCKFTNKSNHKWRLSIIKFLSKENFFIVLSISIKCYLDIVLSLSLRFLDCMLNYACMRVVYMKLQSLLGAGNPIFMNYLVNIDHK